MKGEELTSSLQLEIEILELVEEASEAGIHQVGGRTAQRESSVHSCSR